MALPTAPVVAGALVGGYLVARKTQVRALGGAVLAGGGVVAGRRWMATSGTARTALLTAVYLGGFGASQAPAPPPRGSCPTAAPDASRRGSTTERPFEVTLLELFVTPSS